eukprot:2581053-Pyramimonas_sp.AAC.1
MAGRQSTPGLANCTLCVVLHTPGPRPGLETSRAGRPLLRRVRHDAPPLHPRREGARLGGRGPHRGLRRVHR